MTSMKNIEQLLTTEVLQDMFPRERANDFFDALFGDADEGAFDIQLGYRGSNEKQLTMELLLHERPGRCLACNLTQGLPQVFSRHPVININGVVEKLDEILGDSAKCGEWSLGYTEQPSRSLHVIPINITLQ